MSNADVQGFLLAAILVGAVVSAALVLPLIYTMGVRGWGPGGQAPSLVTVVGVIWLMLVGAGALYLSAVCGRVFGIEGNSETAQMARGFFVLIWAAIGTVCLVVGACLVAWRKQRAQ